MNTMNEGQFRKYRAFGHQRLNEMSDVKETNKLCIPINPNINFSSIQPIAIHGPADALSGFRVVEANHTTALGLAIFHLNISILNHACRGKSISVKSNLNVKTQRLILYLQRT